MVSSTLIASTFDELIIELSRMTTLTTSLCSETIFCNGRVAAGGGGLPSSTTGIGN